MTGVVALVLAAAGADARTDLLIDLVEENGCSMTGEEANEILPEHDFTREETQQITAALFSEGLIRIDRDTDTLILTTEGCR